MKRGRGEASWLSTTVSNPAASATGTAGATVPVTWTVTNLGPDGKPSGRLANQLWHSDKSFRPAPCSATILHAVIMPPQGGDTCFADMYAAYDALSEAEKARVMAAAVAETGLPCVDPVRDGVGVLVEALVARFPAAGA